MAKSKTNKKEGAIAFPEIEEKYFSKSSIIDDFETFIEYAQTNGIELTKSGVISIKDCKAINSMLVSKMIVPFSRPVPKSFPNVLNLFIIFRISGMGELSTIGKKTVLKVNIELFNQWGNFNVYEKYFNLLALMLDHYSFEFINENSFLIRISKTNLINEVYKKKKLLYDKRKAYHFDNFRYKCFWSIYAQFGLVDVQFFEPEEGKNTIIESIILTHLGIIFFPFLLLLYDRLESDIIYSDLENEEIFKEIFTKVIPQVNKGFTLPDSEITEGIYTFNAKLGSAQRVINIDSSCVLDDLCYFILDCFDFDYDHMYMVTLKDRFGRKISYNGCPDMSYAEDPTTEDVTIGELTIHPGSKMEYVYDFGDNWVFEITLVSISPRIGKKIIKKPEIIKSIGKAPKQYSWDDDDEE